MLDKPLMVQSDFTLLLETRHENADEARDAIQSFADLWKRPDALHTYRIHPLSLWNAAASGLTAEHIIDVLDRYAKFGLPAKVRDDIRLFMGRYGKLRMERDGDRLVLRCDDPDVRKRIETYTSLQSSLTARPGFDGFVVRLADRGHVKQELTRLGLPVVDEAGYTDGEGIEIRLREETRGNGQSFQLRDYQLEAIDTFHRGGDSEGGSGVLVLPCGAGKTMIGIGAMARLGRATLILTTNATSVRQWKKELLDKTHLTEEDVGEYGASKKEVRPVTIATYQMLTYRKSKDGAFHHMGLFSERPWGLIVYDEVHLLPAPVFRATADIQATRRLGLTATLVREDGREEDVFSLIGPKRFEVPWKQLERQGWIAQVECAEVRVGLDGAALAAYRDAPSREQHRIAGENPRKLEAVRRLMDRHRELPALVIGQYLDQLKRLGKAFQAPVVTGETPQNERDMLYDRFKRKELPMLLVSKVANFAIDLPDAALAIQVSGSFGSRQEEAQRLGRVLRPKRDGKKAFFYSVVTDQSKEQEMAVKRQLFLVEQGYRYRIMTEAEWNGHASSEVEHGGN